jgi:hypothetical protein
LSVTDQLASGVKAVYATGYAFAALKNDGSVVTWGDSTDGGDSANVEEKLRSGVTAIFPAGAAYAALKTDGSLVTWGNASLGGNSSSVASLLASGVEKVFATEFAFAALKNDGTVVTWGYPQAGGDSAAVQAQLTQVIAVQATEQAFAALKADGTVITWGSADHGGAGGPLNLASPVAPTLPRTLHVRLASTAPEAEISGELTLSTPGVPTQTIALSGTVGGEAPLAAIQAWRQQFFGNPESLGNGDDLAMPDSDGIANLIKYGLCIIPGSNGSSALPELFRSEDHRLAMRFRRDPARNDVNLIVEAQSNTLDGEWTEISRSTGGAAFTGDAASSEITNSDGTRSVVVTDTLVIDPAVPKRFLRVRVEAGYGTEIW